MPDLHGVDAPGDGLAVVVSRFRSRHVGAVSSGNASTIWRAVQAVVGWSVGFTWIQGRSVPITVQIGDRAGNISAPVQSTLVLEGSRSLPFSTGSGSDPM
jgi:hypothetical protein